MINVTALSSVSRKTGADGQWINDNIIKVADDDIKAIAAGLDEAGISELDDIRASAGFGVLAYNKVKDYDLFDLLFKTELARISWERLRDIDIENVSAMALSGAAAAKKILPYDVAKISADCWSGKSAWNAAKDYDLSAIMADAKSARAGYNIMSANAQTIKDIITTYESANANTAFGKEASAAINSGKPTWDGLKNTINASAGEWNKLSSYYDTTKRNYLNRSYDWVSANSAGITTLEQNLGNITNWNRMYNTTCADSGYPAWDKAYSAVMSAYGYSAWNQLPGNTADFVKLKAVSAGSATWNRNVAFVNASATKLTNTFTATTANQNKWITYNKIYDPYVKFFTSYSSTTGGWNNAFFNSSTGFSAKSAQFNNAQFVVNTNSGNWNIMNNAAKSATNWTRMHDTVKAKSANWEKVYNESEYTRNAVNVFSSHSGTQTTPMWEQMAYGKSDWWGTIGSFTGQVTGSSGNWITLSAYDQKLKGTPRFSAALSAGSANYSKWTQLNNFSDSFRAVLDGMRNGMTATSGKWVVRPDTSNALHILRRKGFFTKAHFGASENIAETIFLIS